MTNTNITYTQQGDYLLPDLKLPEQPKVEIGIFGKRRLRYLERNRKILYTNLLTKGKLTAYLADIDEQAENMFDRLVRQLAEREGVTEQLIVASEIPFAVCEVINSFQTSENFFSFLVFIKILFLDIKSDRIPSLFFPKKGRGLTFCAETTKIPENQGFQGCWS